MKVMWICLAAVILCGPVTSFAASDTGETQVRAILEALKAGDQEALRAQLTDEFRADLTDQAIRDIARNLRERLKGGYQVHFLDTLQQEDFLVYFWKVSYDDDAEDSLIRVVIFDGQVAGMLITRPFV